MLRGNAIIFCGKAHCHPDGEHHTLLDIFTSLVSDRFPLYHSFTLWIWLSGRASRGKLAVICDKEDEEAWFTYVLETEIDMGEESERFIALLAERFCFPRPGTYRFRAEWQGTIIAEQWLAVTKSV